MRNIKVVVLRSAKTLMNCQKRKEIALKEVLNLMAQSSVKEDIKQLKITCYMRIEHLAIWVSDLEVMRTFYETYFGAKANKRYHNPTKNFYSYFCHLIQVVD